jgi:hypothetical protein
VSTVKTVRRQDPARTLSGLCQDSVRTLSGLCQDCQDRCGRSTNQVSENKPKRRKAANCSARRAGGSTPSLKDLFLYVSLHRKIL